MATVRTDFRLPAVLLERVDVARGGETRTRFLVRALEAFLDEEMLPTFGGVPVVVSEVADAPVLIGPGPATGRVRPVDLVAAPVSSPAAKAGVVPR